MCPPRDSRTRLRIPGVIRCCRDAGSWRAEFRIPFSQLRYDRRRGGTFGLAVARQIARLNEMSSWPHLPKSASGVVSSFGDLTNLSFERSPKKLELVPYAVADVRTAPASGLNPLVQATDPGSSLGADLKYAVAPGLTLTGTVNPDFGQVEADPAVVNLSAFETFFEERRPFFVEGSGNFQFDIICNDGRCTGLFYSRRIGRPPQGEPGAPEGAWTATPAQSTILGAAKLAGRVGSYSVGVLNALTSSEHAMIADGASRSRNQVEPFTSYTVARTRREFVNRSSVGFMMTATNRKLTDTTGFLADRAYTGGVDWDWRLRASHYSLSGYWAGSTVRGSEAAISRLQQSNVHSFQRPDAGHVDYDPTGGIAINRNVDDAQWVSHVTGASEHYVFAHLDQTTLSLTARVNYTMTPTLSVQVYAQPFMSAGAYTSFKELVDGRAARYEDRYAPFPYGGNPDFNYRSFRTTNVLRWEYRPGSTLFVVWQQGREEDAAVGDFRFARDFRRVFSAPGSNVFLVKLSYWLNF